MQYTAEIKDSILVLHFKGNLIGEENGPEILEIINDHINNGTVLCAIDISEVKFVNSSGIGVFITTLTKFRNKGGEVVLIRPSEQVRKLFIITKLNAIFNILDTEEEALALLREKA